MSRRVSAFTGGAAIYVAPVRHFNTPMSSECHFLPTSEGFRWGSIVYCASCRSGWFLEVLGPYPVWKRIRWYHLSRNRKLRTVLRG